MSSALLAVFLIVYLAIFFGSVCMLAVAVLLDLRDAARARRASRLIAILFAVALAGCSSLPPKVVELPASCPAPRVAPPQRQLPESLPALVIGPNEDPAQAILQNRIASQQAYAECLQEVKVFHDFAIP